MPFPIPDPNRAGFTTTTEVPLYWALYGRPGAPRLVVLHGGPGASHDYLLPQMLALGEAHELLFYDQRGGGRSKTDGRDTIGWATHVADLAAVAAEFQISPLSLVGYSWGGLLALLYAAEARSTPALTQVARMALIDPAAATPAHREAFAQEFARREALPSVQRARADLAASGIRERDPDAHRQRAFELSVTPYFADPSKAHDLTPFRVTGRVQQSVWGSLAGIDVLARISGLAQPAIVIHGRDDPIPVESSKAVTRALGAKLVILEHCGHVPYVEQPAALFAALADFLRETASPS